MPESIIAFSTLGTTSRKRLRLVLGAKAHHAFDAGAVVPTAIEDHDLAGRRQMRQVALDVHLRLLPLGRSGQRDDAEDARTDPCGDRLDDAALAGSVAAFEEDADLLALVAHPLLQLDEFNVQLAQLALVFLALQLRPRSRLVVRVTQGRLSVAILRFEPGQRGCSFCLAGVGFSM